MGEIVELPETFTRVAKGPSSKDLFGLVQNGGVDPVELTKNASSLRIIAPSDYLDASKGKVHALGMTQDDQNRVLVVINQRTDAPKNTYVMNQIIIFLTMKMAPPATPADLKRWVTPRRIATTTMRS